MTIIVWMRCTAIGRKHSHTLTGKGETCEPSKYETKNYSLFVATIFYPIFSLYSYKYIYCEWLSCFRNWKKSERKLNKYLSFCVFVHCWLFDASFPFVSINIFRHTRFRLTRPSGTSQKKNGIHTLLGNNKRNRRIRQQIEKEGEKSCFEVHYWLKDLTRAREF